MDSPVDLYSGLNSQQAVVARLDREPYSNNLPGRIKQHFPNIPVLTFKGNYIHPIRPAEAIKFIPSASKLELIIDFSEDNEKGALSYLFYKFIGSANEWDMVLEYRSDDKEPAMLYYPIGSLDVILDREVKITRIWDVVIHFNFYNGERVDNPGFNLNRLGDESKVRRAYLSFNGDYRKFYNDKFIKAQAPKQRNHK